jgi:hypothetical protein
MSRYLVTIRSTADRERVQRIIDAAPFGSRVEIKSAKRTTPQNDRMWAMLTDIAMQVPWDDGQKLRPDDWKIIFLAALKREMRTVANIDGDGVVNISTSSSDLSKSEMSDLIELMYAFGAQRGVVFQDSVFAEEKANVA